MYPLARTGERFPFSRPDAVQFAVVPGASAFEELPEGVRYTAHLEGVAFAERMAYDLLAELGAEVGDEIYAAGGATASDAWLQVRADVLGKRLLVPADTGGAKGAAVIAAAGTHFGSIIPAAREMVRDPEDDRTEDAESRSL